jgi:hypothetical protein
MDWSALTPAIFSLLGVALGTVGSLVAVFYAQKSARQQIEMRRESALRSERKEVILEYLRATQDSWSFLDGMEGKHPLTSRSGKPLEGAAIGREAAQRSHDLWHQQTKLSLVATEEATGQRALMLTEAFMTALFQRKLIGGDLLKYLEPLQEDFLEAARSELGLK